MYRTVPLSIIKSFSLYTQQWYSSYRFVASRIRPELQFRPDPARKLSANLYIYCAFVRQDNKLYKMYGKYIKILYTVF